MSPDQTAVEALLPCPFCGEHLERREGKFGLSPAYRHPKPEVASYDMCPLTEVAIRLEETDKVRAWNTRASTLPGPEGNSSLPPFAQPDAMALYDFGELAFAAFSKITGAELDAMEATTQQFYINFAVEIGAQLLKPPVQATSKGGVEPSGDCEASYKTVPLALQEGDLERATSALIQHYRRVQTRNGAFHFNAEVDAMAREVLAALSLQTAGAGDTEPTTANDDLGPTAPWCAFINPDGYRDEPTPLPVGEDLRERGSRLIYEKAMDPPMPWIEGGNSLKQDEARRAFDAVLALVSQDQWRPMIDAPRDGKTLILVEYPTGQVLLVSWGLCDRDWSTTGVMDWVGGRCDMAPLRWCFSLPAPPSSKLTFLERMASAEPKPSNTEWDGDEGREGRRGPPSQLVEE